MRSLVHVEDELESMVAQNKGARVGAWLGTGNWFRLLVRVHRAELIAAGLLLLMAVNLISVIAKKSITIDETSAIPSGYYYLTEGAYSQRTVMTAELFWTANRANFQRIFFWARVPMVVITVLLGALIYLAHDHSFCLDMRSPDPSLRGEVQYQKNRANYKRQD